MPASSGVAGCAGGRGVLAVGLESAIGTLLIHEPLHRRRRRVHANSTQTQDRQRLPIDGIGGGVGLPVQAGIGSVGWGGEECCRQSGCGKCCACRSNRSGDHGFSPSGERSGATSRGRPTKIPHTNGMRDASGDDPWTRPVTSTDGAARARQVLRLAHDEIRISVNSRLRDSAGFAPASPGRRARAFSCGANTTTDLSGCQRTRARSR